ncbi:MAG: zeta toxin family protein [Planctomycetaceae bacterium]|nr:zeta toxin family protein [Planctomycetaceae bacterium]MCA9043959.1 zeta toxin family protein [Planctomycetaceae bacterium]MCB9952182.1 zeta toxin family protein [Planctomycetaceae bacterium]
MNDEGSNGRPTVIALAGSNGAGKSTFYHAFLATLGWPFVNADLIAGRQQLGPYEAADAAGELRERLAAQKTDFVFETVFSDPVGDKVSFLERLAESGYDVILCFISISSPDVSEQRVSMRVAQGGHDVPNDKLNSRFERTRQNLARAIKSLPLVYVFDNNDLQQPYRLIATFTEGQCSSPAEDLPDWLRELIY